MCVHMYVCVHMCVMTVPIAAICVHVIARQAFVCML